MVSPMTTFVKGFPPRGFGGVPEGTIIPGVVGAIVLGSEDIGPEGYWGEDSAPGGGYWGEDGIPTGGYCGEDDIGPEGYCGEDSPPGIGVWGPEGAYPPGGGGTVIGCSDGAAPVGYADCGVFSPARTVGSEASSPIAGCCGAL